MSENKQVKNGGREAEPTSTFKIRTKDTSVNLKNIDKNLMGYINTLPEEMQKEVLVTSGNDSDAHSKTSWHYHNKAVDLRYSHKLYNYMATDPNRVKYQISLYNPNHGTGKHLHLSHIGEDGVKSGAKEHLKDVLMNVYSPEAQEYLKDPNNERYKSLKDKAIGYGAQPYRGSAGAYSVAGSGGVWQEVNYNSRGDAHSHEDHSQEGHSHEEHFHGDEILGYSPALMYVSGSSSSDNEDLVAQNQMLISKLMELEDTKKKETEYNAQQAMENEKKLKLAKQQQEFDFIKELIVNTPSMVAEKRQSREDVVFDPNMFQITDFQNNFRVG